MCMGQRTRRWKKSLELIFIIIFRRSINRSHLSAKMYDKHFRMVASNLFGLGIVQTLALVSKEGKIYNNYDTFYDVMETVILHKIITI